MGEAVLHKGKNQVISVRHDIYVTFIYHSHFSELFKVIHMVIRVKNKVEVINLDTNTKGPNYDDNQNIFPEKRLKYPSRQLFAASWNEGITKKNIFR